jgi:hypothetical protein
MPSQQHATRGEPLPPLVALWSGLTKNFLGGDRNPQKKRIRLMNSQRKKKRRVGDHRAAIKPVRLTHAKHGSTIVEPLKTIGPRNPYNARTSLEFFFL